MRTSKTLFLLLSLSLTFVLGGCIGHQKSLEEFEGKFNHGMYGESAQVALKKRGDLLWTLQAAASYRAAADYETSSQMFDQCEDIMKDHDTQNLIQDTAENLLKVLVNDAASEYSPEIYDGIMVNTYKSLNFMALGQMDNARIELNRADDRQRRAVEYFAEEIQATRTSVEKKKAEDGKRGRFLTKTLESSDLKFKLAREYPELEKWEVYPDFVNPFSVYLHGLFFFLEGKDQQDLNKARDSFRRVLGMTPNRVVEEDLAVTEKLLSNEISRQELPPTVWIIFENGLGPIKEERRLDIPMFFKDVAYVGIALPSLKFRAPAYSSLRIDDGQEQVAETQVLSSMDRVVQSEFKKEFPWIVTRSVLSVALKTYAQHESGRKMGDLALLGTSLLQAAMTQADVRNWSALPKDFQIARLPRPASGILRFSAPKAEGNIIHTVKLPQKQFSLVYIKIPTSGAPAVSHMIGFDRNPFERIADSSDKNQMM